MQGKGVDIILLCILIFIGFIQVLSYEPAMPDIYAQTFSDEYLAYEVIGSGPKDMVMIHGSPGDRETFADLAPLLAEEYTMYIYEMPGFGQSQMDVDEYSYETQAQRLYEATKDTDLATYTLLGYSWGGAVAAHVAATHPEDIEELILIGGVGVPEGFHMGTYEKEQLRMKISAPFLLLYPGSLSPSLFDYATRYGFWRSFLDSDTRKAYNVFAQIQVPTRIIHGNKDTVVGVESAHIHHELIPNSTLEWYKGNHGAVFINPEVIAEVIVQ